MSIEEKVRGTVAQGWCTKENEHKVMDVDLALAIAQALLSSPDLVIMETNKPTEKEIRKAMEKILREQLENSPLRNIVIK